MFNEENAVMLDESAVLQLREKLSALTERIKIVQEEKISAIQANGIGEYLSPDIENIIREETRIQDQIDRINRELNGAQMISESSLENVIGIGDILNIEIMINGGMPQPMSIKLVSSVEKHDTTTKQVSLKSPIGQAIYLKLVGETVTCEINGRNAVITIGNKVNEEELNDNSKLAR